MTSIAARPSVRSRGVDRRPGGGPRARGARRARPGLESAERRDLPSASGGILSFVSAPTLHPAAVDALTIEPGASLDPIFVAPYAASAVPGGGRTQAGPLIADAAGNPIWFQPINGRQDVQALGFRAQALFGRPVLTWWQGTLQATNSGKLPAGTALSGEFVIADQHYRTIRTIRAPRGTSLDLHELLITPQGDAYYLADRTVRADLTPFGGPAKGSYVDPVVYEQDLRTGRVVFTWDMAAHVPPGDSVVAVPATAGQAWDPYHANSIDVSPDGAQVLVSARNTWGIYDVERSTGRMLWQLGGKRGQFRLPAGLVTGPYDSAFQYQHDARFVPGGISLFDNAGAGAPPDGGPFGASRGLVLAVDPQSHVAALAAPPDQHAPPLYANSQGNLQDLAGGATVVGWGLDALSGGGIGSSITEYAGDGSVLADYALGAHEISYRAFRLPWVGLPLARPAAVGVVADGRTTVYASWNGSTETRSWALLAGPSRSALAEVSVTPRTGFETAIVGAAGGPFFEVEALDAGGRILGTSAVLRAGG